MIATLDVGILAVVVLVRNPLVHVGLLLVRAMNRLLALLIVEFRTCPRTVPLLVYLAVDLGLSIMQWLFERNSLRNWLAAFRFRLMCLSSIE